MAMDGYLTKINRCGRQLEVPIYTSRNIYSKFAIHESSNYFILKVMVMTFR